MHERGYLEAMLAQDFLIVVRAILAAPVGMLDAALGRGARDVPPVTDNRNAGYIHASTLSFRAGEAFSDCARHICWNDSVRMAAPFRIPV